MEVVLLHTCLLCFEYYSGYCFSSKCQKTIELFFFEFTICIFYYSLTFVLTSTIYLQYVHVCTEVYTTLNHWAFCHTSVEKYCSWGLQHQAFFFVQLNPNVIFPSSPWVCFLVGFGFFFFCFWLLYDLGKIHKFVFIVDVPQNWRLGNLWPKLKTR